MCSDLKLLLAANTVMALLFSVDYLYEFHSLFMIVNILCECQIYIIFAHRDIVLRVRALVLAQLVLELIYLPHS